MAVQVRRPRCGRRIMAITRLFQGRNVGSIPIARLNQKQAISPVFECLTPDVKQDGYLAYSITRFSRMTLTLISPGYFNSASILSAISLANFLAPKSSISSGFTKILTSLPA